MSTFPLLPSDYPAYPSSWVVTSERTGALLSLFASVFIVEEAVSCPTDKAELSHIAKLVKCRSWFSVELHGELYLVPAGISVPGLVSVSKQ